MARWRFSPAPTLGVLALLLLTALAPAASAASEKDVFIIKPGVRTVSGTYVVYYDQCWPLDGNRCERHDVWTVPRICVPYVQSVGDEIVFWYCDETGWREGRIPAYAEGLPGYDPISGNVYSDCKYSPRTILFQFAYCDGAILNVWDTEEEAGRTVGGIVTGLVTGVGYRVVTDGEGGIGVDVLVCGSLRCEPVVVMTYAVPSTEGIPGVQFNPCGWWWTFGIIVDGPMVAVDGCADADPDGTIPVPPLPVVTPPSVSGGGVTPPTVTPPAGDTGFESCWNGVGTTVMVWGWGATSCTSWDSGQGGQDFNIDLTPCPQGTDPRVDLLGFWVLVCVVAEPHTGGMPTYTLPSATLPTVNPGGVTVPPWDPEDPDIDTSSACPTGSSDPAVTWYGWHVAACGGVQFDGSEVPQYRGCTSGAGGRVWIPEWGLYGACASA